MALLTMTILSTALAATTSVMAWRLARREARRSDARVAALAAAIYGAEAPVSAETSAAIANFPSECPAAVADGPRSMLPGRRFFAVAVAVVVGVVAGIAGVAGMVWLLTSASTRRGDAAPGGGTAVSKTSAASAPSGRSSAQSPAAVPLELIALNHERTKDGLIVRGAIRNPSKGSACVIPAVVVLAFDEHGIFLGSGESEASGESLAPGGRATFSVSVPARTTAPARYKVSFRSAGQVVPHVDRRVPDVGAGGAIDSPSTTRPGAGAALPVQS